MIVTALSSFEGHRTDAVTRVLAARLATGLAGRPPDVTLDSRCVAPASLRGSDVLVIATRVDAGSVDPGLLGVLSERDLLRDCAVFVVAVGHWPGEVGTVERTLLPLLRTGGCVPVAPTLHVVDTGSAPIEAYCRYWGPVVGALSVRRSRRSAAA
jgi:hypothetical protein